jgi:hypothetical protein
MDKYRKNVQLKMFLLAILALTAVALGIYNVFFEGDAEPSGFSAGMLSGFRSGLAIGIGGLALIRMIGLGKAIRDEKKLKELYNKEHDERLREIRAKAGMPLILITSVLMLVAALIAGPLSLTIFYTLLIASVAQLLIGLSVKMYYLKKM